MTALGIALVLTLVASIMLGWTDISAETAWRAFFAFDGSHAQLVLRESRIQRTLAALIVGAALGLAGAVMQALTRNPLADPGLLGVNAGAGFSVTIAVFALGGMTMGRFVWFSLLGAFAATVLVTMLGASPRRSNDTIRIVLAGVAVSAVLMGLSNALTVLDPDRFYGVRFWGIGSVANLDMDSIAVVLPFVIVGAALALALARPLNTITLGDAPAQALGVNVAVVRAGSILAVTLLAGAATALVGMIAFIGLVVPHLVRAFLGPDQRWVFPATMIGSAALVLASDTLGRFLLPLGEMPVSIVLACVGSPVLIVLARRRSVVEL